MSFSSAACRGFWPALGLLFAVAGVAGASEARRSEERLLSARQLAQVIVENPAGSIELIGEARDDLALAVDYRVSGRGAETVRGIAAALRLEASEQDGRLRLRPVHAERDIDGPRPASLAGAELSIAIRLRLPARLPVAASVTRDKLVASGLAGDLVVAATSGDIELRRLAGRLEAGLTSGFLRASDVARDVAVTTTSGSIDLRRIGGDAELRSISGEIRVEALAGDLTVETSTGDLMLIAPRGRVEVLSASGAVAIREPGGDLKVNCASGALSVVDLGPRPDGAPRDVFLANSSGDVELLLLPGADYAFEAVTDLGAMQLRIPLQVEALGRRRVAGLLGAGQGQLKVVTATGDIRIALASEATRTAPQR